MRISSTRSRLLQLSLFLCCLSLATNVSAQQISASGVIPGSRPAGAGGALSGPIQFPDGTAAAPSITFVDETNSGVFRAGAGSFDISIVGTRRHAFNTTTYALLNDAAQIQMGLSIDVVLSRVAAGQFRVGSASNANTYDITLADWGTTLSAEGVSVADTGLLFLGTAPLGELHIQIGTDNTGGHVFLRGSSNGVGATTYQYGMTAHISTTKDNPSTINVYYDAVGASGAGYYVQNLRGGTRVLRLTLIGG